MHIGENAEATPATRYRRPLSRPASHGVRRRTSGVFDFTETPADNVVDEAANRNTLRNPWMRAQLLELVLYIFFDILERIEERWSDSGRSGAVLDSSAQILLAGEHQSAIGVIDDHNFLGAQQVVRDHQRAQSVFRNDASGIANDVSVSGAQPKCANRKPSIHAGQDGKAALGARGEFAQFVCARINFVCGEHLVDNAHGPIVYRSQIRGG